MIDEATNADHPDTPEEKKAPPLSLTLDLVRPPTYEGNVVQSLTLRELKTRVVIALDKQAIEKNLTALEAETEYLAASCGVAPGLIDELYERDWRALKARYWATLGNVAWEPATPE